MFYVRISNPIGWTNEEINFSHFGPTDRWGSGSFLEFGSNSIRCPSCTLVGAWLQGQAPRGMAIQTQQKAVRVPAPSHLV